MRTLLFNVLIVLLCITLCVNFIRITVSGDFLHENDHELVQTITYTVILQDLSAISGDSTILLRNMTKIFTSFMELCRVTYDAVSVWNFEDKQSAVVVIKNILYAPAKLIASGAMFIGGLIAGVFDICQFVLNVYTHILDFLNHLLGFDLPEPDTVPGIGQGIPGGGFGGRR